MDYSVLETLKSKMSFGRLSKPAIAGIAVVFVMVAALTAGRLLEAAAANDFEISPASATSSASVATSETPESPPTVFVHVSGSVEHPGLYELPEGSRIADAVQAAGGFTEEAQADSVNLARVLVDGEQVRVVSQSAQQAASALPTSGVSDGASGSVVNINTATADELVSLPGVGQATALKIVSDREANGPFKTVDDLQRVSGIGQKKLESLRDYLCV